jgi:hypothetical protein
MSGRLLDSGRHAIRTGVFAVLAGWLCVACGTRTEPPVVSPEVQDGVARCPEGRPPTTRAELDACVGGISFDTAELVGDEQRLMVNPPCPSSCRYGPLARIEPAKGAHQYTDGELTQGRVIARLFVRKGEKGYPKLALTPGDTTYWWVQKSATGRGGKSIFISQATVGGRLLMTKPRELKLEPYAADSFKQSIAGWYWLEDDETAKGTCGTATCK